MPPSPPAVVLSSAEEGTDGGDGEEPASDIDSEEIQTLGMYMHLVMHEHEHAECVPQTQLEMEARHDDGGDFDDAPELEDGLDVPAGPPPPQEQPPLRRGPRVVGSMYRKGQADGDFSRMIRDNAGYPNTLFIFNDSADEHAKVYEVHGGGRKKEPKAGGGNACVRPYNMYGQSQPPRAAGVSTGW